MSPDQQAPLDEKLRQLIAKNEESRDHDPTKVLDTTRAKIALFVVISYFLLIAVALIGGPVYNLFAPTDLILSINDLIATLAAVFGGPFGFVVGYYFKSSEKQ